MSVSIPGYRAQSDRLVKAWANIDPEQLYQPVSRFLPQAGESVLDIGAGTGRNAAWFASLGCDVVAVEPVEELWRAPDVTCIADALPDLSQVLAQRLQANVITLTGVWHHLTPVERNIAWRVLPRLLKPAGRVILSLRHGPTQPGRPGFDMNVDQEIELAENVGFTSVYLKPSQSVQAWNLAQDVTWTWLVLEYSGL